MLTKLFLPLRSTSDFDFGLGSFSLLEEIVTGQEWAKFLNPNLTVPQRTSEDAQSQPQIQTSPHDFRQSSAVLNPFGSGSNQWSFRSIETSAPTVFSVARTDASLPISMDVSDQPEPMEDMQVGQRRQTFTPPTRVEVRYLLMDLYKNDCICSIETSQKSFFMSSLQTIYKTRY